MAYIRIILLSIVAAILYGIFHDQITARICVEYFTVGHPPVFHTEDPTLLGLGWGIIATWWVGAILGIPLALAARVGSLPKRSAASLVRPVLILLACMSVAAALAGIVGWILARNGTIYLTEDLALAVPPEKHISFLVDLWVHLASYASGSLGGIILIVLVLRQRFRAHVAAQLALRRTAHPS